MIYIDRFLDPYDCVRLIHFTTTIITTYRINTNLYKIGNAKIKSAVGYQNISKSTRYPGEVFNLNTEIENIFDILKIVYKEVKKNKTDWILQNIYTKTWQNNQDQLELKKNIHENTFLGLYPDIALQSTTQSQPYKFGDYFALVVTANGLPFYFMKENGNVEFTEVAKGSLIIVDKESFFLKYEYSFVGLILEFTNRPISILKDKRLYFNQTSLPHPYTNMQGFQHKSFSDLITRLDENDN